MTFKVSSVALTAADTPIFETPFGAEGAAHGLVISNPTADAVALTVKFFDASENTTSTLLSGYSVAPNALFSWPKPINLNGGDKIIASGAGLVAVQSTFISEATIARSFTHRGEYVPGGKYGTNDVVSLDGSSYVSLVEGNENTPPGIGWGLYTAKGDAGVSVSSVVKTAGTGAQGTTDTYTITLSNGATTTFPVYNGADGVGITSVVRTAGTGAAGTTDTYTISFSNGTDTTFSVYNGADGVDGANGADGNDGIDGEVTLATPQTLTNKTFTGYTETVYNLAGTDIAVANGTIQTKTLDANTTFTESLADGQSVILGITAGAYSVTWPSVTWVKMGGSGTAPTLTSSGVNWIILWKVGGVLRGSFMGTA